MKTIFIKDDRLRKIITDRNAELERLLRNGTLRGTISVSKVIMKELKGVRCFGWEITYDENGCTMKERFEPTGSIVPLKDLFKSVENIGVFPKPEIERNDSPVR